MKYLIFCFAFLTAFACSHSTVSSSVDVVLDMPELMPKEDIVQQLMEREQEEFTASYDQETLVRKENLVPMDKLLKKGRNALQESDVKQDNSQQQMALQNEYDYTYRDTPIKSQWNGTCTAFASVAGLENALNGQKLMQRDLSEVAHWNNYHQYSLYYGMQSLQKNPIPDEGDTNPHARIVNYRYLGSDIQKVHEALGRGNVVTIATRTPSSMLSCDRVVSPNSSFENGGHALLISKIIVDNRVAGGGYFGLKNSWGSDCGDNGYQYFPFNLCSSRAESYCEFYEIEKVESTKYERPYKIVCKNKFNLGWPPIKKVCEKIYY